MRTGLVAKKLGMTRVFTTDKHVPATLFKVESPVVVANKTKEKNGYTAVVLGYGTVKAKHLNKQQQGQFAKAKVEIRRHQKEFRVEEQNLVPVGSEILASHFIVGQFVDATGTSIGRGFQGVMKRHNFAGLEASHGVSVSHRSHGSTGQRQDPGKVFKGKKMAGHMGSVRVTAQNLEVILVDEEQGLIAVKGNVPGAEGSSVILRDAVKIALPLGAPLPAKIKQTAKAATSAAEAQPAQAEEPKA